MENAAPTCQWHPGVVTYVVCSRCGRAICPACMTSAPVGFHCPTCVAEGRPNHRQRKALRAANSQVTNAIIILCIVVFGYDNLTGNNLAYSLGMWGDGVTFGGEWYRMVTSIFLHSGIMHIMFNMLILHQLGVGLERYLGSARFLALFLLSGIGGSFALLILAPGVLGVGASGAVFGLMGAYAVLARRLRMNDAQIRMLIAINLAIGFLVPGIAWQAHVGGLIVGAGFAAILPK